MIVREPGTLGNLRVPPRTVAYRLTILLMYGPSISLAGTPLTMHQRGDVVRTVTSDSRPSCHSPKSHAIGTVYTKGRRGWLSKSIASPSLHVCVNVTMDWKPTVAL
ncbi:hypothetical protein BDM02DRAFT_3120690 [Thelephora ganbajun]|uniref:Uncharacterized protein n=1 Tax=Thelephora ganbajun TaxID=370292 RepID=A0ACB6Z7L2_THEGA|nr:hypothetical protein BDM02DRAFT_3120690 [Thelephora ganbajun]